MSSDRPSHCIDPVMKYCQGCKYGFVHYPEWVETYEDLSFCSFDEGCIYGLEDDPPTPEEEKAFEEWCKNNYLR